MGTPSNTTGETPAERAVSAHAAEACVWCERAVFEVEAPACRTMVRLVRAAAEAREAGRR